MLPFSALAGDRFPFPFLILLGSTPANDAQHIPREPKRCKTSLQVIKITKGEAPLRMAFSQPSGSLALSPRRCLVVRFPDLAHKK